MPNWHDYNKDPKAGNNEGAFILVSFVVLFIVYTVFFEKEEKSTRKEKDEIHQIVPDSLKNISPDTLKKP